MKLYDVNRNTRIRLLEDANVPLYHPPVKAGAELNFDHTDGMYSLSTDDDGNTVNIAAWTEVEVLENTITK